MSESQHTQSKESWRDEYLKRICEFANAEDDVLVVGRNDKGAPGQLPTDWTVEKLKAKHSSQPFNPNVANFFFRAGVTEAWGRGIERILAGCRDSKIPEPILEYETTGIWVKFPFSRGIVARIDGPTAGVTPENFEESARIRVAVGR